MIDDLFYGEIHPYERPFSDNPKICATMKTLVELEEQLRTPLNQEQLDAFSRANGILTELSMLRAFEDGFRVGFGIAEDLYRQQVQPEPAK